MFNKFRSLSDIRALITDASCAALAETVQPKTAPKSRLLAVVGSRQFLTAAIFAGLAGCGMGVHAADTGTIDTNTLDSGAFNGVVSATGTYVNNLIKNFGVPAILVGLAVSGWAFVRHIAKSAFH